MCGGYFHSIIYWNILVVWIISSHFRFNPKLHWWSLSLQFNFHNINKICYRAFTDYQRRNYHSWMHWGSLHTWRKIAWYRAPWNTTVFDNIWHLHPHRYLNLNAPAYGSWRSFELFLRMVHNIAFEIGLILLPWPPRWWIMLVWYNSIPCVI